MNRVSVTLSFIMIAGILVAAISYAGNENAVTAVVEVNMTSIIMNGIVRITAILAGVCIVWLGHNSMIRGVKGEFEFEGKFAKLKGSTPGLLFVLLGTLAIGWALNTPAKGGLAIDVPAVQAPQSHKTGSTSSSRNGPTKIDNKAVRASDKRPGFMNHTTDGDTNDG